MDWSSPSVPLHDRTSPSNRSILGHTFPNSSYQSSSLPTPQSHVTAGFDHNYNNLLQRMKDIGLPTSATYGVQDEPPVVSSEYLDATGRILINRAVNQIGNYPQTHTDRTQQLTGSYAIVGSEQHFESVKDFVDKTSRENFEALLESEDYTRSEAKRIQSFLCPDLEWEQFKENCMLSYAAAGSAGMVEMLRRQRLRSAGLEDRQLTSEEKMFERVLRDCNEEILCSRGLNLNIAERFRVAVEALHDKTASQLWRAFTAVVHLNPERMSLAADVLRYRLSAKFSQELVPGARSFLEQTAYLIAEERLKSPVVERNDLTGSSNPVVPYTRVQLGQSRLKLDTSGTKLHGLPIWALIFYAVRLGSLKSAIAFCGQGDEFTKDFVRYITEYGRNNGSLMATSQQELRTAYRGQSTSSVPEDIYKRAVFGVLSRAEPEQDFGGITHSVGDWLWMKLAQTDNGTHSENFSLSTLQQIVRSRFPEGRTDDMEASLAFILTGQFEVAVDRLFQNSKFRSHAVHMSLALKHLNLLLLSYEPGSGSVLISKTPLPVLDFATVIRAYTNDFRKNNVATAMEYYFHLSDTPAVQISQHAHEFHNLFELLVYKLARDSNKYAELFGCLGQTAGIPARRGLVDKFIRDSSMVINAVADDMVQDGRIEDAVALYELAGNRNMVFRTLLRAMAEDLIFQTSGSRRTSLRDLATVCAKRFAASGADEDAISRNFCIMLDLVTFFGFVDAQEYRKATFTMQSIKVIPLEESIVEVTLLACKDLLPEVRECIPHTVLRTMQTVMNCYLAEKEHILGHRLGAEVGAPLKTANLVISGARLSEELVKVQTSYRKQSRAILKFAHRIPFPQLPNLMDLLVKLDGLIS